MPQGTLEERVAYLEGKVEEQSRGYGELREWMVGIQITILVTVVGILAAALFRG